MNPDEHEAMADFLREAFEELDHWMTPSECADIQERVRRGDPTLADIIDELQREYRAENPPSGSGEGYSWDRDPEGGE